MLRIANKNKQSIVFYFIYAIFFILSSHLATYAQIFPQQKNQKEKITWTATLSKTKPKQGEVIDIIIKASIDDKWHLYSSDFDPNLGPMLTEIVMEKGSFYLLKGKLKSIKPKEKYDSLWGGKVRYFERKAEFRQSILVKESGNIAFEIKGQICQDEVGCLPINANLSVQINASKNTSETSVTQNEKDSIPSISQADTTTQQDKIETDTTQTSKTNTVVYSTSKNTGSMWLYILFAIGSGVIALLTPCVYPMIPMTVSLFTKNSKSKKQAITKALIYGLSIIGIYTLLALVPASIFGVDYANLLSTHWLTNLLFFAVFILFGISFLGMFELTLPNSLVNKMDAQADKSGGYTGIFFMAFTLVLVSFSCTAPFVGTILIESQGAYALKPVLGMLAYSTTFALPFTLFALFPSMLKSLPKSGSWLNTIKVVFGFLELGLALKFLSTADLVYHWGLLDRDIFIAIWLVLAVLLGIYLLGGYRLPHDSPQEHISVGRFLFALIPFVFAAYLLPGLFGAPLKALSGIIPPMATHDFVLGQSLSSSSDPAKKNTTVLHSDILHLPHQLEGYFDYDEAIEAAKAANKPLFIDFTGHGCANCRKMEDKVWADARVLNHLRNNYVVVALYVDERRVLPSHKWITTPDGKIKKTVGEVNHYLEINTFGNAAQPYYVLLDPFTKKGLVSEPLGYEPSADNFVQYLESGLNNYKKIH